MRSDDAPGEELTHFGFRDLPMGEKQAEVDAVFARVASRYDVMNDLMSAGLHRVWKDILVSQLRPGKRRGFRHLDVAGGTGDVAFRILDAGGPSTAVSVLDINPEMLAVGRERAARREFRGTLDFIEGDAQSLPYEHGAFDGYTIAFGIRNVPRIERALQEAFRVLKRGGHLLVLEFAPVEVPVLDRLYDAWSFAVIPRLGQLVTGDRESYQYLVESIRKFPRPPLFARMVAEAGFRRVEHRALTGGVANIHSGWKL